MASSATLEFASEREAPVRTAAPAAERPPVMEEPAVFGPSPRTRMVAITAVIGLHALVLAGILAHRVIVAQEKPPQVIELLDISAPPAPPPEAAPEIVLETPPVIIPPPVFEIENRPPTITAVVSENFVPPPERPVVLAPVQGPPAAAPARPPSIVSGVDLSASVLEAVPPRYPHESRRQREQGTVVLDVLLALDGRVNEIRLHSSSGFARLDKAALEAVRRWRWSPMMREGKPVAVRGLVEIPFVLSPSHRRGGEGRGGRDEAVASAEAGN